MSAHAAKLPACPNCATDLSRGENFCPTCGQPNHDVNVSFGHVVEETLEGVFHFDSKVWRTFRELVLQPGKLTVDFLAGRRARFVPPIRLYIFLSVIFFFLLNKMNPQVLKIKFADEVATKQATATDTLNHRANGVHPDTSHVSTADRERARLTKQMLNDRRWLTRIADGNAAATDSALWLSGEEPSWFGRMMFRRMARAQIVPEEEKSHTFVRHLSIGMFLLMPLFALLLKLFYRRQRPLYVQHLIFSVHLHSFLFLALSVVMLVRLLVPATLNVAPAITLLFLLGSWVYWVVALRAFTGQSWLVALGKGALLFGAYMLLLTLFVIGLSVALLLLL